MVSEIFLQRHRLDPGCKRMQKAVQPDSGSHNAKAVHWNRVEICEICGKCLASVLASFPGRRWKRAELWMIVQTSEPAVRYVRLSRHVQT